MSDNQLQVVKQNQPIAFNFFDPQQFAVMQTICEIFSNSELVPEMYRISEKNPQSKAHANCMIAIDMAQRMGANPLMVMQNLIVVKGRPSWSAKFLISTINSCGKYDKIKYKISRLPSFTNNGVETENLECIAYTKEKGSDDILESSPVTIFMAFREGWLNKDGSKWKTMPQKMLRYRAASFWVNENAPELSMGIRTVEETEDIDHEEIKSEARPDIDHEIKEKANGETLSFDDGNKDTEPDTLRTEPPKEKRPF